MFKTIPTAALLVSLLIAQSATAQAEDSEEATVNLQVSSDQAEGAKFDINVTSNPFYLLFGGINAAASFRLNAQTAVGPSLWTMSILGSRMSAIGVQGQYHLQDGDVMGEGLILDSSFAVSTYAYEDIFGETERETGALAMTSVNWQWFYENGFNFRLGLGVAANMGGIVEEGSGVTGGTILIDGDNFVAHAFLNAKMAWAF